MNTARNLDKHYSELSRSVRRLSSGLRVGTAADDAAGLAIRELMRADIAAVNQGIRNANDAISMIQTVDGALSIIDEKLIRMKELAEQAATGTYNSDQRLMIDSEFQAMAAEIDRIANATDFNGVHLLNNNPVNKLRIDDGFKLNFLYGGNNEQLNYGMPIISETKIVNPEVATESVENLQFNRMNRIISYTGDPNIENWYGYTSGSACEGTYELFYDSSLNQWSLLSGTGPGEPFEFYNLWGSSTGLTIVGYTDSTKTSVKANHYYGIPMYGELPLSQTQLTNDTRVFIDWYGTTGIPDSYAGQWTLTQGQEQYPNAKVLSWNLGTPDAIGTTVTTVNIDLNGDNSIDMIQTFTQHADNTGHNGNRVDMFRIRFANKPEYVTKIHFGPGNDAAEDYYYIETKDCTAKGLGIDQTTIETQDKAQNAITTINDAIIKKDQARAYFGAMQNRLENTISNLQISAENLQASESRISDVDVAEEMTTFIRNQVLTQAAVAMLAQANSLPQMALQLIQG
jgi:flagellin